MSEEIKEQEDNPSESWDQLTEEFIALLETYPDLTIKQFCNMRPTLADRYNTARVAMRKRLKKKGFIPEQKKDDHADDHSGDHNDDHQNGVDQDKNKQAPNKSKPPFKIPMSEAKQIAQVNNAKVHGIYSKYIKPESLEAAANGTLFDDLLLFRAKAIDALDKLELMHAEYAEQDEMSKSMQPEERFAILGAIENRITNADKALGWCLHRVEVLSQTLQKLELGSVLITHERAKVIKTRAQTKAAVQQTNKFRSETKLAKVRAADIERGTKGGSLRDIVSDIQKRRDSLPSFVNQEEEKDD
ncbi:MAG: hypothetical protein ACRCVX_02220 [Shewanella sp.]